MVVEFRTLAVDAADPEGWLLAEERVWGRHPEVREYRVIRL
jgi:hypothetical protein